MGLEKLGAISAGLGDKINDNADKALNKARAMDVSWCYYSWVTGLTGIYIKKASIARISWTSDETQEFSAVVVGLNIPLIYLNTASRIARIRVSLTKTKHRTT